MTYLDTIEWLRFKNRSLCTPDLQLGLREIRSLISLLIKSTISHTIFWILQTSFVFGMCHLSWAVATTVKFQLYIGKEIIVVF